ncbi:MAG: alpha-galactosidase [Bacteroidetes bacterium]|nr:MAG: alpha-galactosidase [Bacteroidota bacterium]
MKKLKITVIGAGSREFGPATINDILLSDALNEQDLEMTLMDVNEKELPEHKQYAERVAQKLGRTPKINYTTNLEKSLEGADFVITAIEIRRYYYWSMDFHVPRKYGFRQIYGENGGPGGLFHALRNFEPSVQIVRAMEKVCPDAWLLNYTNPLTKLCELLTTLSPIKVVGLCHGVFQGKTQLCHLLEMDMADLDARASGLNHFTWFHTIRHKKTGEDLYPKLKTRERQAHWLGEWDEIALSRILMRVFGLYPSPGTNHIGEYIRWAEAFLGSSALQYFYDPKEENPWETGRIPTYLYNLHTRATRMPLFPEEAPQAIYPEKESKGEICPSGELAIPIIEGLFCGRTHELAAVNVPNTGGLVPGLDEDAVIEVPAVVNSEGLRPEAMPRLPEGILALLRRQTSIHKLLVEAYVEGSKNKLLQALLLDPTVHSYHNAVECLNEMCALQKDVLPRLEWT